MHNYIPKNISDENYKIQDCLKELMLTSLIALQKDP